MNKETREVGLQEITELAQKGADYDRTKGQLETSRQNEQALQAELDKQKPYMDVLTTAAEAAGIPVDQFLEQVQVNLLMGKGMTEKEAKAEIRALRAEQQVKAMTAQKPKEQEREKSTDGPDRAQTEIAEFAKNFPDVHLTEGTMGQFYGMDVVPFIDELMPKNAQFMFINPKANIAPKKINSFKGHVDPPRINGDLLEFLMYHDAFVLGKKADGILVASLKANVTTDPSISMSGAAATITCSGATIYYTTNGADPRYSKDAKTYTSAVTLSAGDQLRAYAVASGKYASGVVKQDYNG